MPVARTRIEIVETDAAQPWRARIIRSGKTWWTENYLRKVGAERAIIGLATVWGWTDPVFSLYEGKLVLVDAAAADEAQTSAAWDGAIRIFHVDETT